MSEIDYRELTCNKCHGSNMCKATICKPSGETIDAAECLECSNLQWPVEQEADK